MPKVPQINVKAIFEKAAGHPAQQETRTIVCGEKPIPAHLVDTNHTLNGIHKPGSFSIVPSKRREQFFV